MKIKFSLLVLIISFLFSCSNDDDNSNCFSPTQNLTSEYEDDAIGCDCDSENDIDVCEQDENGRNVALICFQNQWRAVEDGPCSQI